MADFLDGYKSIPIPREDKPCTMGEAVTKRWKDVPEAYPYGKAKDGGGGGGDA